MPSMRAGPCTALLWVSQRAASSRIAACARWVQGSVLELLADTLAYRRRQAAALLASSTIALLLAHVVAQPAGLAACGLSMLRELYLAC